MHRTAQAAKGTSEGSQSTYKRGRDRFRIADPFEHERWTDVILTFLETTDVGRKAREEEWQEGSDGFVEQDGEVLEVEAELVQGDLQ